MREFWIIGFGRVGQRALERLRRKSRGAAVTVVDPRYPDAPEALPPGIGWQGEDGVAFLLHRLSGSEDPSPWIVPAVPIHLAYEWLAARLRAAGTFAPRPVPDPVAAELPNAVRGPEGQVFISIPDFTCPETCSEPPGKCPVTGEPRPFDLHAQLAAIRHDACRSIVIRSFQLAPGLGGYRGRQLTEALETVRSRPGAYFLSTASKCHGVLHAFEFEKQDSRD